VERPCKGGRGKGAEGVKEKSACSHRKNQLSPAAEISGGGFRSASDEDRRSLKSKQDRPSPLGGGEKHQDPPSEPVKESGKKNSGGGSTHKGPGSVKPTARTEDSEKRS